MYRVFYLNTYKFSAPTRDQAIDWILNRVSLGGGRTNFDDYEILDGSDNA